MSESSSSYTDDADASTLASESEAESAETSSEFGEEEEDSSSSEETAEGEESSESDEENSISGEESSEKLPAMYNGPLYTGAKLTVIESYMKIMKYALRHSLTKQALSDLLILVDDHLPTSSLVSQYRLKKTVSSTV